MSSFALKLIAMFAMLCDHIAAVFGFAGWDLLPFYSEPLRIVGRIAYPIFALGTAVGWKCTRSRERYFTNLCLCAVCSQIPFSLAFYPSNTMHTISAGLPHRFQFLPMRFAAAVICIAVYWIVVCKKQMRPSLYAVSAACLLPTMLLKVGNLWILAEDLNVVYTLALGAALLWLTEEFCKKSRTASAFLWLSFAVGLAVIAYGIQADYGIGLTGILLVFGLYLTLERRLLQGFVTAVWGILLYAVLTWNGPYTAAVFAAAVLICFCSGKRGYNGAWAKKLFYIVYPVHLMLLGLCNVLLKCQIL